MKKVFCIGFQKTGTTSLEAALGLLGYRVTSTFGKTMEYSALKAAHVEMALEIAAGVDAVQDMPWPLLYRELDAAFPCAKFILTERDEDAWWFSILGHFGNNPAVLQQLTYGEDAGAPLGNEARYRETYRAHNAAVREYFADRPDDLLIMDLKASKGWDDLCAFLEQPVPDVPFPKANQPFQDPTLRRKLRRNVTFLLNKMVSALRPSR